MVATSARRSSHDGDGGLMSSTIVVVSNIENVGQDQAERKAMDNGLKDVSVMSPFEVYNHRSSGMSLSSGSGDEISEGSHSWPSIAEEMEDMVDVCYVLYPLADLYMMIREGGLKSVPPYNNVPKFPQSYTDVMHLLYANIRTLREYAMALRGESRSVRLDALRHVISKRQRMVEESYGDNMGVELVFRNAVAEPTIEAIGIEPGVNELAYMVVVDTARRRIVVAFQGKPLPNGNGSDQSSAPHMKTAPNPVKNHREQTPTILFHADCYNALMSESTRVQRASDGVPHSRYAVALRKHLRAAIKKHPSFLIYVTGHGPGAGIANLFAFHVAAEADKRIPKPVTCVSIAGTAVGDESFRSAHQVLEGMGRLRHLRVSNCDDLVTTRSIPSFPIHLLATADSETDNLCKDVGMNVHFIANGNNCLVQYPRLGEDPFEQFIDDVTGGLDSCLLSGNLASLISAGVSAVTCSHTRKAIEDEVEGSETAEGLPVAPSSWHTLSAYKKCIDENRKVLGKATLNKLYADTDIVGELIAQF